MLEPVPKIRCATLEHQITIVVSYHIRLQLLREVLHPLSTSSILRKSDARIPVPGVARLVCTIVPLPYPVFIDHVGVIFEDILCKDPFGQPFVAAVLLREVGAIVCCHRHQ